MEYLSTKYGLVTDNDSVSENGQLFLAELILLNKYMDSNKDILEYHEIINSQLYNSFVKSGLYNRNPDLIDRRIMSHDNLSGIFSYSYLAKTQHRFNIWDYLLKHLGTYDNSQGKTKQLSRFLPFNPSNFFIWGLCAESKIYLLFAPLFLISLLLTCNRSIEDTSGKILAWVEMLPHNDHWLVKHFWRYYERKMKSVYGIDYVKALMKIYHEGNSPDFPINKLLGL